MRCGRGINVLLSLGFGLLCSSASVMSVLPAAAQSGAGITVTSAVPNELNPPFNAGPPSSGGAPAATPAQAAAFAWQEFIALTWPAGPQQGQYKQREAPSSTCKYGDSSPNCSLLVWETFRGKAEIFPGDGTPPSRLSGIERGERLGLRCAAPV
jgi:hypothetical protein